MWSRTGLLAAILGVIALISGCAEKSSQGFPVTEDKVFTVTPVSLKLQAGIVTGEISQLKITEQVEKDSGRVVFPPKFSGTLVLKNSSADQSVRLLGGKVTYVGAEGQSIKLAEGRTAPVLSFTTYASDRLDPGQETTQSVDWDFPAAALTAKNLKEIRLELAYVPSPYRRETVNLPVAIGSH